MRAVAFVLVLLASAPALAQEAPPSAAEMALAAQVVEASGGVEAAKAGMAAVLPSLIASQAENGLTPEIGAALLEELGRGFDRNKAEFISATAAVYAKHFTEAELRDLLVFLRSPAGKSYVAKLGPVMQDAAAVGDAFAHKIMPSVMERLAARFAPPRPRT